MHFTKISIALVLSLGGIVTAKCGKVKITEDEIPNQVIVSGLSSYEYPMPFDEARPAESIPELGAELCTQYSICSGLGMPAVREATRDCKAGIADQIALMRDAGTSTAGMIKGLECYINCVIAQQGSVTPLQQQQQQQQC